jgi:hypothetical protein
MPTLTVKHEVRLASSMNIRNHKVVADVPEKMSDFSLCPAPAGPFSRPVVLHPHDS